MKIKDGGEGTEGSTGGKKRGIPLGLLSPLGMKAESEERP